MTTEPTHQRFTAEGTAYMRSLDRKALNQPWTAILHQAPPRKTESGTSHALRFPILIVTDIVSDGEKIAAKIADILNKYWDDAA